MGWQAALATGTGMAWQAVWPARLPTRLPPWAGTGMAEEGCRKHPLNAPSPIKTEEGEAGWQSLAHSGT